MIKICPICDVEIDVISLTSHLMVNHEQSELANYINDTIKDQSMYERNKERESLSFF